MNFTELLADYYLGNRTTSNLPEIALVGVQEGLESESLLILAGMHHNDNQHEIASYFEHVESELNIISFPPLKCATILLKHYLSELINKPNKSYDLMTRIHCDIYTNLNFDESVANNSKYLGDELGLEKMYTWYRELQDWEDGSALLYYNNLSRPKQRLKFIEELISEAEIVLAKLNEDTNNRNSG